jgi:hypothetical protein
MSILPSKTLASLRNYHLELPKRKQITGKIAGRDFSPVESGNFGVSMLNLAQNLFGFTED